jgi:surface polysaccharide O-acyltransferase-like enzyme
MQRIQSFDLARGFTVLMMPMIHVVMLYSTIPVQQSLLGDILGFIAEGPGAQLFMLLMGISFTFSKRITKQYVLQRAFYLLIAAYLLNFFKFIVPLGLGLMPENLLAELGLKNDFTALNFFLLIGDILHFAAIAYLILFFITRTRYYPYISLVLAIAIMWLSPYVWDVKTNTVFVDQLIILFNGHPPQTFFPAFPWLVYPLMGLTLGYLLKYANQDYILKKTGISGIGIMVISFCFPATTTKTDWLPFYRTEPADTLFRLGFVLLWLAIFHWLYKKIPANPVSSLLTFCSKHITAIYIIQWILICWCMAFTGYLQLNFPQTICWMLAITIITLLLTYGITKSNANRKSI